MEVGKVRVRRAVAEKRRIVELMLEPGASVSRVARSEGVNAHQVFDWRHAYRSGELIENSASSRVPVVVTSEPGNAELPQPASSGSIHIEIPERATISVEPGADTALLRTVLELLRK